MRIYLDNCCFNRPFDDQTQLKIRLETEAKLHIQRQIMLGEVELVWSYILEFENNRNVDMEVRNSIHGWKSVASVFCVEDEQIVTYAESLYRLGIKPHDALHISCAFHSKADYFITTDNKLINKKVTEIAIVNPLFFIGLED